MFKVGDKVFDNERGYGEGVVILFYPKSIIVDFSQASNVSYTHDGRWLTHMEQSLFKKEEKMKNYYYVGQKVSHQAFGDGVVNSVKGTLKDYPIIVDFENSCKTFTVDGRYKTDELPSLSQKPHVPLELEEVVSFEKGELVWIRCGINAIWNVRFYSHYENGKHKYFDNQIKEGLTSVAEFIRKFSDNPLI